ncbi:MAG TPA: tetratricopeptide repeat protein [Phycisphaerae bacterium]
MERNAKAGFRLGMVALLVAVVAGCSGGGGERAVVPITYVVQPAKELPAGITTVAILDSKVNEATDKKWSEMAANYIQHLVQESNDKYGSNLRVADRKQTSLLTSESDLAAAGIVDSPKAGQIAKQLAVQGFILSEINVKVDTQQGKQRTISAMDVFGAGGHGWGGGGGGVNTTEAETATRNILVQTDFKLVDATTGKNWDTYSPPAYRKTDKTKASPFFGSSRTEAEMTPRDEVIAAAVEQGARQFISRFVPCEVSMEFTVESSKSESCKRGVAYLRGGDYEQALANFKAALAENPNDDRASYGAGVASEAMGDFEQALKYYQQAAIAKGDPRYTDAQKRLKNSLARIRKEAPSAQGAEGQGKTGA